MTNSDQKPLAIMVVGGNGAGKTTFIKNALPQLLNLNPMPTFINADIWQAQTFGRSGHLEEDKKAQAWAEQTRLQHIKAKQSFIAETVFSHPSKIELVSTIKNAGFTVLLIHVGLKDADLALHRIRQRVKEGGHDVPIDKVKERYDRLLPLVAEATHYADLAFIYDNSKTHQPHNHVMSLQQGQVTELSTEIPQWVEQAYKMQIDAFFPTRNT
ncbi:zeta toxin family protein [Thiofilum flexile]|uniref:zeta toxin family protein n=1 Tax=Thiofilum flexile TaxID=125627 RepID=UPI00037D9D44|nr:zeta toxin family protein [Thiofilum flexile]